MEKKPSDSQELKAEHLKKHQKIKKFLLWAGWIMFGVGIILIIIAIVVSIVVMDDKFVRPFFIGVPGIFLLSLSISCFLFYFLAKNRFHNENVTRIIKADRTNYILEATRDETLKTLNNALIKQEPEENDVPCPRCNGLNGASAKFCVNCGHQLKKTCKYCGNDNQSVARFCHSCGKQF